VSTEIAEVATRLLHVPFATARGGSGATGVEVVHVTLTDGDGATGTGFTYALTGGGAAIATAVERDLAGRVRGTHPAAWTRGWEQAQHRVSRLGGGAGTAALSAVDIAMWDLRAVRAGLPLHRFLGSHRDAVPAYGSGRATNDMSVADLIEGTQAYLDQGYAGAKLRAGTRRPPEEVARLRAVRDAVGDDVLLMVDCNERLDLPTAIWLAPRLADLGLFWLEEPLPASDVEGHVRLAAVAGLPIAAGEHLHSRFAFADYARRGAASVLQPDAPLVGGVTEFMRIATIAEVLGATVTPHFLPELHVHLTAAAPTGIFVEHFPLIDDLLAETLSAVDGVMTPPDRPGHGIRWDPGALTRFAVS
jgi:L-alanine-DL-glutamate epimerase-like enolase superfamily enzyme